MLRLAVSLLLLLVLAPPHAAAAPAWGPTACPYDLATATQMIPRECYANATAGQAATGCCWYVFAAYIFAAADYANRTGAAFLPLEPAAACSDAFAARLVTFGLVSPSLLSNNGSCDLTGDPGKLAAGSRPCQLAALADVRAMAPRALPNATRLCAAPGVARAPPVGPDDPGCAACRGAVIATTYEMLASAGTKEFVPCGMAATVAVWSRAPPPLERFRAYALCMLQVLENVNSLGTSDLVPSPPPPTATVATQSPRLPSSVSSRKNTVAIAVGSASAVVVSVVAVASVAMAIVTIRRRRRTAMAGDGEGESDDESVASVPPLPREGLYIFTKSELKQATNGYDEKLLLGSGGAGKVYLGRLPSGQRVAIKKIYRSKKVAEFYAEVAVLAKLRHRNLTTLVGYCLGGRGGHHALVYEYLAGGNLWRALFQGELPWLRRLQVAADVAQGLAYLHGFREGAVVHRDVKPTNVLLSESGTAKLSDFGVSRIMPEGGTHVSTEVRGTRGYVDPESFSAGHVSEAGDVYSFGVVLLELATGMRAVVPTPSGGAESIVHAAHWAVGQAGGEAAAAAESMVDERLGPDWDRPTVRAVFALACRCVRPYKHERPAMGEVLAELKAMLADYAARADGDADRSSATMATSSSAATPDRASLPSTSSSAANTEVVPAAPRHDS
ncbi:proline-rich receptor-like protein kinase PERK9 [Oryza brachyantha]|uniref:proline-rich receptor-like protein kinase PERK9 n=1 Tax=Oryza brachyantha TaxID=4533 RepID=UPI001ADA7AAF|nr:proline-rich receptor-like protein kinase PERK9 [Oryza brachyantha]